MDNEKLIKIAEHYGLQNQLEKFGEEVQELYQEIEGYEYNFNNQYEDISISQLVDEMADVKIMIAQMEYLLECKEEVSDRVNFKLDRQLDRMKVEGVQE